MPDQTTQAVELAGRLEEWAVSHDESSAYYAGRAYQEYQGDNERLAASHARLAAQYREAAFHIRTLAEERLRGARAALTPADAPSDTLVGAGRESSGEES